MGVSKNNGTPNHPFVHRVFHYFHHPFWWFSPYFWFNIHIDGICAPSPGFPKERCISFDSECRQGIGMGMGLLKIGDRGPRQMRGFRLRFPDPKNVKILVATIASWWGSKSKTYTPVI